MAPMPTFKDLVEYYSLPRKRPPYSYIPDLAFLPTHIKNKYMGMCMDEETALWLENGSNLVLYKVIFAGFLRFFFSCTTANGIVNSGRMFVMSTAQAVQLLMGKEIKDLPQKMPLFDTLLDLGAGHGGVTSRLQPLFRYVMTTESSFSMRWRLWWQGFEVISYINPFLNADGSRRYYNVISCLNLLDRVDMPLQLLCEIRESLAPNGILLLAVVLPWCPFVEYGTGRRQPSEKLPMEGGECCKGASYEESLRCLVDNVLVPYGFKLERWCKLPYFCEGNLRVEYAVLHDAVLVLTRANEGS